MPWNNVNESVRNAPPRPSRLAARVRRWLGLDQVLAETRYIRTHMAGQADIIGTLRVRVDQTHDAVEARRLKDAAVDELRAAAAEVVGHTERMVDDWADGDEEVRRNLWRRLHELSGRQLGNALDALAKATE